jgi:hypothetical protein
MGLDGLMAVVNEVHHYTADYIALSHTTILPSSLSDGSGS